MSGLTQATAGLVIALLAWAAGAVWEGCRRGGTIDLHARLARLEAERGAIQMDVQARADLRAKLTAQALDDARRRQDAQQTGRHLRSIPQPRTGA